MTFRDRADAGRRLARRLAGEPIKGGVLLALPRGGVPVAWEISRLLGLPLDVVISRKLGAPGEPELAIGALALVDGVEVVLNDALVSRLEVDDGYIAAEVERQRLEAGRRAELYRRGRPALSLAGRTAIVVDDGLVTGATARAALLAARKAKPERVVLASPLASREAVELLAPLVDSLVVLETPEPFIAVGEHYDDFAQVSDEEVVRLLARHPPRGG